MPSVTICAADTGCAEALAPIIQKLIGRVGVQVYVDRQGGAGDRFDGTVMAHPIASLTSSHLPPDTSVLLATTAGKRQDFAVSASEVARQRGASVVWLETMYFAARTGLNGSFVPDHLIVIDESAVNWYRRGGLDRQYPVVIHALGQPAFDGLRSRAQRRDGLKIDFRNRFKLGPDEQVLSYFASSSTQVDPYEAIHPLCAAIRREKNVWLVPRFHPADPKRLELQSHIENHCSNYLLKGGGLEHMSDVDIVTLSDAVAVQFSTVGLKAAYMQTPVLFLWTKSVQRHFSGESTDVSKFPPLEQGTAMVAHTTDEALTQICNLLHDRRLRNDIVAAQRKHFSSQADAAEEIAELVVDLSGRKKADF